ncbi:MAG: arylsulfatase A-like enzyme [Chlamydiales bacterium]|jgi:arylsulfatase A-like enzyme
MRVRLFFVPLIALFAAAVDVVLVRRSLPHRPTDVTLFPQAALLWLLFGLVAYYPARFLVAIVCRGARRPSTKAAYGTEDEPAGAWACGALLLAVLTTLPVIAHSSLARHIQSADDLSALYSARPWVELGATILGTAIGAIVLGRIAAKVHGGLAIVFVLGLAGAVGAGSLRPARRSDLAPTPEITALPSSALDPARPNLLLLVWDTTRAKSLSTYGYDRATTPNLAALAEGATVFEQARSVSSFTYTSHLSMLTGVYPSHHGGRLTRMSYDPELTPSIANMLHDSGYRTAAFVGTGVLRASTGIVEGFEVFDDQVDPPICDTRAWALVHDVQALLAKKVPIFRGNGNPHWIETFQRPAAEVLERAQDWIVSDDPRPWFCMVNLYDVHWPYLPVGPGRELFVRAYEGPADGYLFRSDDYEPTPGERKGARFTEVDDRHLTDLYDAEMFDLDAEVGSFLDGVLASPGRDTAMLLTADHGEAFGESDAYGHHGVLEAQVRVPMILLGAGTQPGRVSSPVSGVDVGSTLLAVAGLDIPGHMTGRDLTAPVEAERVILVEHRDTPRARDAEFSVYQGTWKLTRKGLLEDAGPDGGHYELFDLERDPEALSDVGSEHPERVRELAALLQSTQAQWGGDQESWSVTGPIAGDHLKALGYGGDADE